jgi:mannose-6-phosphate isomerase-like protein (cupin superfamily)
MEAVNLAAKLASFDDLWQQRLIAELNGQHVKLVKLQGTFVWHHHEHEDELFMVLGGRLLMEFRDRESGSENQVWLEPGEMIVVPRGVEHRPHADEVTSILLFEPASTVATGNLAGEQAAEPLPRI